MESEDYMLCVKETPISICTLKSMKKHFFPCERQPTVKSHWDVIGNHWKKNEHLFDENSLFGWKKFVQLKNQWNDKEKPYFNIYKNLPCPKPTFLEFSEILSDRMIAENSSCLDKCPETFQYVLTKVELSNMNLIDISVIKHHRHLQYVDLSFNHLEDINALGSLTNLIYLDVSHNKLKLLLDFKAPFNLMYVNFSYNLLDEITNISDFWSIICFNLSNNNISEIKNLDNLKYLQILDLSYNRIEILKNIPSITLQELNLKHNLIWTFENSTNSLNDVIKLNLSHNYINKIKILDFFSAIKELDLSYNSIDNLLEFENFKWIRTEILNLTKNPITNWTYYRYYLIYHIKSLRKLDNVDISSIEKIKSKKEFKAKRNRYEKFLILAQKLILSKRKLSLDGGIIPMDQVPVPLIAVVGPLYSIITDFIQYISDNKKYNDCFYILQLLVTECNIYKFSNFTTISNDEFVSYIQKGKFKAIGYRYGLRIGLTNQELENFVLSGKIGLINAPLNLIQNLRMEGIDLTVICAFPEDTVHQELVDRSRLFISTIHSQTGAYFYKKRQINQCDDNWIKETILDNIIEDILSRVKVIESNELSIESLIQDACLKDLEEELNSVHSGSGSHVSFLYNLQGSLEKTFVEVDDTNIYSRKMMRESADKNLETTILPNHSDLINVDQFSGTLNSSFSTLSIVKSFRFSKDIQRSMQDYINNFDPEEEKESEDVEWKTLLSDAMQSKVTQISIKFDVLSEEEVKKRKRIIDTVTRVFLVHDLAMCDLYYNVNENKPGIFSKFVYITREDYTGVIIKTIKDILKVNRNSLYDRIKVLPEYIEEKEKQRKMVTQLLEKNSSISRRQGFDKTLFNTKRCRFY